MNQLRHAIRLAIPVGAAFALFIALASPAEAATIDEIIEMSDAGVPPEVIIEVIEATGVDEPLDDEAWQVILDADLDPAVLEYLILEYGDIAGDESAEADESESGYRSNMMGGEGFHHEPTGYDPLYGRNQGSDCSRQSEYWGGIRYYDSGIYVYEPPVYVYYDRPYGGYYYAPRLYSHDRHYYGNGWYSNYHHGWCPSWYYIPDRDWWDDYHWHDGYHHRDRGWGSRGWFGWDGRGNRWDNSLGLWYRDDDWGFRISF